MNTINKITLAIGLIFSLGAAAADSVTVKVNGPADPAVTALVVNLKRLYPTTSIKEVQTTPVPGIFQVVMGRNVAFVDETGRYFIFGHMFDMKEQRDLTEDVSSTLNQANFGALPFKDAIVTVKGDGSRKVAVFSDPDCPYCKQLEATLARTTNVTIYTFLMPLEALHPDSKAKAVAVWCTKDRVKAWGDLMLKGSVAPATCADNPIDRNLKFAESLGINGTPTLIFPSGQLIPGSPRPDQLEKLLGEGK